MPPRVSWINAFTEGEFAWKNEFTLADNTRATNLSQLKRLLDIVHIKHCLIRPYQEQPNYPILESRELLPSFDPDPWEHKNLPGFSMVAFGRPLNFFEEVFQFDLIYPPTPELKLSKKQLAACQERQTANLQTMLMRLPRRMHDSFRSRVSKQEVSSITNYPNMLEFLLQMDRAHVLGMNDRQGYSLAGIYASFPSDLDSEIKRFGLRLGKFKVGDNESYINNRLFVYQYLMELYGFPIASERRTSSALFARNLHKMGEHFLIRVLGQSDRMLTTLFNYGETRPYPHLEKTALVQVDEDQEEALEMIADQGFFLDVKRRVVILRVNYVQHKYNAQNVREDRALSVSSQEVIHPLTGQCLCKLNIVKDSTNLFLRLNDITRGEYSGRIVYKRYEVVENTDTDEKRLKFLYAWLSKHQRRIISYSEDFYANVVIVLERYLLAPENYDSFDQMYDLYQDVLEKFSYIQQARKVRALEDIKGRLYRGERLSYRKMLQEAVDLLRNLKFEIISYFDSLVLTVISLSEDMLNDRYLIRTYIECPDTGLSPAGLEIRKNYRRLVGLVDEFRAIRRSRAGQQDQTGE